MEFTVINPYGESSVVDIDFCQENEVPDTLKNKLEKDLYEKDSFELIKIDSSSYKIVPSYDNIVKNYIRAECGALTSTQIWSKAINSNSLDKFKYALHYFKSKNYKRGIPAGIIKKNKIYMQLYMENFDNPLKKVKVSDIIGTKNIDKIKLIDKIDNKKTYNLSISRLEHLNKLLKDGHDKLVMNIFHYFDSEKERKELLQRCLKNELFDLLKIIFKNEISGENMEFIIKTGQIVLAQKLIDNCNGFININNIPNNPSFEMIKKNNIKYYNKELELFKSKINFQKEEINKLTVLPIIEREITIDELLDGSPLNFTLKQLKSLKKRHSKPIRYDYSRMIRTSRSTSRSRSRSGSGSGSGSVRRRSPRTRSVRSTGRTGQTRRHGGIRAHNNILIEIDEAIKIVSENDKIKALTAVNALILEHGL